ncbi:hypothetical protein HaLaN_27355, partial [Haematococcus lacustris]
QCARCSAARAGRRCAAWTAASRNKGPSPSRCALRTPRTSAAPAWEWASCRREPGWTSRSDPRMLLPHC